MTQRSNLQNRSMYKWFLDVARELEAQGITRTTIVNDLGDAKIPITDKFVKEAIWAHYMLSMYGHESTTKLTTLELTEVEKATTLHLVEHYGLQTEWPCEEARNQEQNET